MALHLTIAPGVASTILLQPWHLSMPNFLLAGNQILWSCLGMVPAIQVHPVASPVQVHPVHQRYSRPRCSAVPRGCHINRVPVPFHLQTSSQVARSSLVNLQILQTHSSPLVLLQTLPRLWTRNYGMIIPWSMVLPMLESMVARGMSMVARELLAGSVSMVARGMSMEEHHMEINDKVMDQDQLSMQMSGSMSNLTQP